ncbi:unnamed protein product [Ceutorhynchus assimilis]|uniref:Transcription termination factor 2 n=1 Tax=Ceutorhynchus assimilis TaxID=467358 RepID=A0A9P0DNL5_9CUCU|nr:unnamed protein product [Ceutorhynchus assimilis]
MSHSNFSDSELLSSDEEDSSYKRTTKRDQIDSDEVIQESGDESSETDPDLTEAHFSRKSREVRESGVFPIKQKRARPLALTDSDSDVEAEVEASTANLTSLRQSRNTTDRHSNISDSDTDVESDKDQTNVNEESESNSDNKEDSEVAEDFEHADVTPDISAAQELEESESSSENKEDSEVAEDFEHADVTPDISATQELELSNATKKRSSNDRTTLGIQSNSDLLNLSSKFKNNRMTEQFQFNTEGILNSTCINNEMEESPEKTSFEILENDSDEIIEVSSREISPLKASPFKRLKPPVVRQQTLNQFVEQSPQPLRAKQESEDPLVYMVSNSIYENQWSKVDNLNIEYEKLQKIMESLNVNSLPDKGELITRKLNDAKQELLEENKKFKSMKRLPESENDKKNPIVAQAPLLPWADLQAGANAVQPKTFGKQALSTYNAQKAVTMDRLQQLHGALETCPKDDDFAEDPRGLKVDLMAHQRRALAWLMFREKEKPSGGILADDMGLGKTLTMISLIVKVLTIENQDEDSDEENKQTFMRKGSKVEGGSLIVCPASLLNQWSGEIDRRLKRGLISYNVYHGPKRETIPKNLAKYDVVITTYAIVNNECDKNSTLFRVKWRRIVLDEAHQIRNYKAQTSEACCRLSAKSRWALTGTPMHNKELDMYAYLKFLRCSPFDDLQVWKRWVADKSQGGSERLHTVISSLMLRRTKVELMEKGTLNCMPKKEWQLIDVELDSHEMQVYHKILIFSQTLFAQFLHQRADKNQDIYLKEEAFTSLPSNEANQEYFKMRKKLLKLNKVKNVSQHEILVLLLRLRQICCHPSLITSMLQETNEDLGNDDEESADELNILEQLNNLKIEDEEEEMDVYKPEKENDGATANINTSVKVNLKEATRGHLKPSDPVFAKDRPSSKIKAMLKVLHEKVLETEDKAIIVSQWSSYLNLLAVHLKEYGVEFDQLDGKVPVPKRMDMVNRFNDPKNSMKILLLSLTAGGVGLNLVGANHLFLLDLHWNPQLENQAQDRIYRVGQQKAVFVYKFIAINTIEERIKALQDKKLALAEGILTGTRQVVQNKLSLEDLKMIFGMNGM